MSVEPTTNNPPLAEIRFSHINMKEEGIIIKMDTQVIGLRITDRQSPLSKVVRGEVGEVVFTVRGIFHRFQVVFLAFQENVLLLAIGNVLRGPQLRRAERVDMVLHVSWRALRNDGSYGAWYSGLTQDMSITGAKIIIPAMQEIPQELEALLYLSEEVKDDPRSELNRLNYARNTAPSEPPVKIRGRVRHFAQLPDTRITLGILFTRLSDVDRVRVQSRLLESQADRYEKEQEVADVV